MGIDDLKLNSYQNSGVTPSRYDSISAQGITNASIPPLFNFFPSTDYANFGSIDTSFNFSNYNALTKFTSPFNNFGAGFGNIGFTDIISSQLNFFQKLPFESFNLGIPDLGYIKQKKGRIPLSPQSCKQIEGIANRINANPLDIQALIYSESGGNPQAVNKTSGASGLIQFMPKTARALGTSVEALRQMTAEQQMPYVEKYLAMAKRHAGFSNDHRLTAGELYAIVFMPARAKNEVLCRAGSAAYSQNKGLDKNNDGIITTQELNGRLLAYHEYAKKQSRV